MIRAAGIPYDIRKAEPYCIYDRFDFDIPTLPEGDIYARYYIRLLEARESVKILQQALRDLPEGEVLGGKGGYTLRPPEGEVYHRVEAPKGELGFYCGQRRQAEPIPLSCTVAKLYQRERAGTDVRRLQDCGRRGDPRRNRYRAGRSGPLGDTRCLEQDC